MTTTSWSTRADLTIIGATLEVTGLALLALDFFAPTLGRGWEWLTRWGIRTRLRDLYSNVIARLTGTKGHVHVSIDPAVEVNVAGALSASLEPGRVSSFDQVHDRLQAISDRITSIETRNAADHEKLRDELVKRDRRVRRDVEEWIAKNRDRFLPWRVLGFALALTGTIVLAAANLVS